MTRNPPRNRPKFVLIEQSLQEVGGHYFEYAYEVLQAAEEAAYEPVLACHRDFSELARFPDHWRKHAVFPYSSDRIHRIPSAYSFGLWRQIAASRGNLPSIAARVADAAADRCKAAVSRLRWWRRVSRVRGFAAACESLFGKCPLDDGDQVFCSTMSDMDLLGLVRFLRENSDSSRAAWHLQFHFSVYQGRDPDYAEQDRRVDSLRRRMAPALKSIPRHRLHFYTTTDELGRQFNRLSVAKFQTLPWPVGRQFHGSHHAPRDGFPHAEREADHAGRTQVASPMRVLCAGAVRREKGSDHLGTLAASLWDDLLKPGAVQLLFQMGKKRRAQSMLELPKGSFAQATDVQNLPTEPLVALPHPLEPQEYARLIKSADVGLLLYNSDVYFARCSGILAELLAAGVPVIVPAGCWLAEQIAEENFRYLDVLGSHLALRDGFISRSEMTTLPGEFAVPSGSRDLLVRTWRAESEGPGSYFRIQAEQFDANRQPLGQLATIVGHRDPRSSRGLPVSALFHVAEACASVRVTLSGAYRQSLPPIEKSSVEFLAPVGDGAIAHRPAGKIGLTMAEPADVPVLLRDIVSHYAHYREAARAFAKRWIAEHAAVKTIEQLATRATAGGLRRSA